LQRSFVPDITIEVGLVKYETLNGQVLQVD